MSLGVGFLLFVRISFSSCSSIHIRRASQERPQKSKAGPVQIPAGVLSVRKRFCVISGLAVYSFTAYGFYLYQTYSQTAAASKHLEVPVDVSDRYNQTANSFDDEVSLTERLMGIGRLRKKLSQKAYGNVLEAAVGTGRNMQYYNMSKVKSLTVVDQSAPMVSIARQKFRDTHPHFATVYFHIQSSLSPIPCASSTEGFDSIVQTMGLCSTPEPARTLRNFGRLLNREDGQILLLEHGRSHYQWLNQILDNLASAHADKHGCWWNRDIAAIVEESGLEVVRIKRYHLGTTWWIELRARKEPLKQHQGNASS